MFFLARLNVKRGLKMSKILLSAFGAAMTFNLSIANAKDISLNCNIIRLGANDSFTAHIEIAGDGVTFTSSKGGHMHFGNTIHDNTEEYARTNSAEITFGMKWLLTGGSTEVVIDRKTGELKSTQNASLIQVGTCSAAAAVPNKF
jgi:hypothetical protein